MARSSLKGSCGKSSVPVLGWGDSQKSSVAIACIGIGLTLLAIGLGLLPRPLHADDAAEKRPVAGEFASEKLIVGKETREYRLFVPKSIDLTKPAPLVIAFHGMLIDSKVLDATL